MGRAMEIETRDGLPLGTASIPGLSTMACIYKSDILAAVQLLESRSVSLLRLHCWPSVSIRASSISNVAGAPSRIQRSMLRQALLPTPDTAAALLAEQTRLQSASRRAIRIDTGAS